MITIITIQIIIKKTDMNDTITIAIGMTIGTTQACVIMEKKRIILITRRTGIIAIFPHEILVSVQSLQKIMNRMKKIYSGILNKSY